MVLLIASRGRLVESRWRVDRKAFLLSDSVNNQYYTLYITDRSALVSLSVGTPWFCLSPPEGAVKQALCFLALVYVIGRIVAHLQNP